MEILDWIETQLEPRPCNSEEFIYDDMESQSGRCLPVIYQPFDAGRRTHWRDRGALFDFLSSTDAWDKRVLDFGPGDGWPSLIMAPFVGEVVGVEGSRKRCEVCRQNGERLAVTNARFQHVTVGSPLPFGDNAFDAATAASSIEQTPDPRAALREIHRVLKPGGRVRISYEDLERYRNGREFEIEITGLDAETTSLLLYDRHIDEEYARMFGIVLSLPQDETLAMLSGSGASLPMSSITVEQMEKSRQFVIDARVCRLSHPSGETFAEWLKDLGFSTVMGTHNGAEFAGRLFDGLPQEHRPKDMLQLDRFLRPAVGAVVDMAAPLCLNPMLTAAK
jgi:ubiquinone/menaquinone biosynthesis C-methylase UbiE